MLIGISSNTTISLEKCLIMLSGAAARTGSLGKNEIKKYSKR